MYITFVAVSPCPKTVSFLRNLATFLPKPVESRNSFTLKARLLDFVFLGKRGTLPDALRAAAGTIGENIMERDSENCSILHSLCRCPKTVGEWRYNRHNVRRGLHLRELVRDKSRVRPEVPVRWREGRERTHHSACGSGNRTILLSARGIHRVGCGFNLAGRLLPRMKSSTLLCVFFCFEA